MVFIAFKNWFVNEKYVSYLVVNGRGIGSSKCIRHVKIRNIDFQYITEYSIFLFILLNRNIWIQSRNIIYKCPFNSMNRMFYWINIQVVSWRINVWDSKAIQTMYSCTTVTAGIYTFLFQKQRFAEWPHYQTYLGSMTAIIKSSSNWNIYWVVPHKSMSVTVSSKHSWWKGYGKDSYSMETLVTLGKSDGTSWLADRATVIATSHWWWVVSDINWNFSKFNTKFSTVWDVEPLSDGCRIHSEQV